MARTAAEDKFIHEYTRQLLVGWAAQCIYDGAFDCASSGGDKEYLNHAIEKGWVSKDGTRVLAAGYIAAAGQLKR